MTIGARIKQARTARSMKRTELARATGIPYPTLAGIENGDQDSTTQLHVIAKALGVSIDWLATGKGTRDAVDGVLEISQVVRLDPKMIADTAWALREAYEAVGREFRLEEEPERFVQMYLARLEMEDIQAPDNMAKFVLKAAGIARPKGEDGGQRGDPASVAGASKKGVSGARRKG